ncbi:MAG: STAS domain-containing protein [Helicobacteraceae bacterium]|jgi:SulP family sulfate permease|nr:STAS domain-containing protein [Helicobacteraceae bacterium]
MHNLKITLKNYLRIFVPQSVISLKSGYKPRDLISDTISGLTVAVIAVPLAMAIAIASGLSPEKGLFTAIVAGFFISFLGGSKHQIGGPTAAFAVTVATVYSQFGFEGLVIATAMAGIMLIFLGLCKAGILISFIPYPVITGFTSGIAILLFFSQLKDFLGLQISGEVPPDFLRRLAIYAENLHSVNMYAVLIAAVSMAIIIFCKKFIPRIPGPVVVVGAMGLMMFVLPDLPIATIENTFGAIPNVLPSPALPEITFEKLRLLFPSALTITLLAAIESLLSAVVADGMAGTRHNSNSELVGQGVANVASACFGGICATGAIARTAANIQNGAKSPISGMLHAAWLLLIMFLLAPFIAKVPLAALSGILIIIAWNMCEIKRVRQILKAPKSDAAVLFMTLALTVLVDLNIAILAGISMASLVFIQKMMDGTQIKSFQEAQAGTLGDEAGDPDAISKKIVPPDTEVYELFGPLFFGVADRLRDTLRLFSKPPKVFILRMRYVPMADAAGLNALEVLQQNAAEQGTTLVLSGVSDAVYNSVRRAGLNKIIGDQNICNHIDRALARAEAIVGSEMKNEERIK